VTQEQPDTTIFDTLVREYEAVNTKLTSIRVDLDKLGKDFEKLGHSLRNDPQNLSLDRKSLDAATAEACSLVEIYRDAFMEEEELKVHLSAHKNTFPARSA
jgi:hypothetical protein